MSYVVDGSRAALGVLFFLSVVSKSRNRVSFREFRDAMVRLAPWTAPTVTWCAVGVVVVEWAVVVVLAVPGWFWGMVAGGFVAALVLLVVFSAVLVGAIRRGVVVGCRCFGSGLRPVGAVQVLRNVLAIVVAAMGLVSLVVGGGGGGRPEGIAISMVAGLVLGALLVSLDELVDLFVDQTVGTPRRVR